MKDRHCVKARPERRSARAAWYRFASTAVGFITNSGYNEMMNAPDTLITGYRFELNEDHHSFGSGRYSGRLILTDDISASFPYLNTVLDDAIYDHENCILIGMSNRRRYAFRPLEIQVGMVQDPSETSSIADEVIELVNRVWREHESITPSFTERKLPAVFEIYKLLPGTNCRECGYPTCLACAAGMRNGVISLEDCPLLSKPEYRQSREQISALFYPG